MENTALTVPMDGVESIAAVGMKSVIQVILLPRYVLMGENATRKE